MAKKRVVSRKKPTTTKPTVVVPAENIVAGEASLAEKIAVAEDPAVHPENLAQFPGFIKGGQNPDYIEPGSDAHAVLLGFDPETMETMFDTSAAKPEDVKRFVEQRKRWLEAEVTPPGPEVPPMWSPHSNPDIKEVS